VKYQSVSEIIAANKAAGFHFFDSSTMRWFSSRVLDGVYGDGTVFVTSEKFEPLYGYGKGEPRYYTVRQIQDDGNIKTVGEFQQWVSAYYAKKAAKEYAEGLVRDGNAV